MLPNMSDKTSVAPCRWCSVRN